MKKKFAFLPYVCLGYPSLKESIEIIHALEPYADGFELGIPFSDPVADGPVLQKAMQKALENGFRLNQTFEAIKEIRVFTSKPLAIMSYLNPLLAYGLEEFVFSARAAGASALLVPDAPLEEIGSVKEACSGKLEVPLFISPTTQLSRCAEISDTSEGFVYAIAVKGVTGERVEFSDEVSRLVEKTSGKPVAVGFGISSKEQAEKAREAGAHGVIVGSKIVKVYDEGGLEGVKVFAEGMKF
ncbi:tryptophan synthase subunit alpha [Candidatus Micrarchaeota archaeon]|nr:tryptophan synthase subunit alpha [Candidatus Micrarchaeota archaeon]